LCETGTFAIGNDIEEPFHSPEWEPFSARRSSIKALPRPVEDYLSALKEMMDAASKASMLFDDIYSFCYKSDPTGSGHDSVNIPMSSVPADVLRSGQAYQRLVLESLQVIQKLADRVSTCAFPPDSPDAAKSSDHATPNNFSFHKTSDFGKFHPQRNQMIRDALHLCVTYVSVRRFAESDSYLLPTETSIFFPRIASTLLYCREQLAFLSCSLCMFIASLQH